MDQQDQSSSLPLNSGSLTSLLQFTSCSLGAAAMGSARPQSFRGSDLRSSPQNHAHRYHGGSYADAWGK
eukprot:1580299-Pyramimonas_sp.AAC.1